MLLKPVEPVTSDAVRLLDKLAPEREGGGLWNLPFFMAFCARCLHVSARENRLFPVSDLPDRLQILCCGTLPFVADGTTKLIDIVEYPRMGTVRFGR